jgi:hypothetical protein
MFNIDHRSCVATNVSHCPSHCPMVKAKATIPGVLPISPITLVCPFCKARAARDCTTSSGGLPVVNVQRIKAAAAQDKART